MKKEKRMRNIWYFVGWLLLIIGLVELTAGVYDLFFPINKNIRLTNLHANLWWGVLIVILGAVYLFKNKDKYIDS